MVSDDAVTTQCVYSSLPNLMCRQFAYENRLVSVVSAADSDVGLAAAPYYIKIVDLHKAVAACRREAKHDFAECDYFSHICYLFIKINLVVQI